MNVDYFCLFAHVCVCVCSIRKQLSMQLLTKGKALMKTYVPSLGRCSKELFFNYFFIFLHISFVFRLTGLRAVNIRPEMFNVLLNH